MKRLSKLIIVLVIVVGIIAIVLFAASKIKKENKVNSNQNTSTNTSQTESSTESEEQYVQTQNDGTLVNTSSKLKETKEINGFKMTNIIFTEQNGESKILADVTNMTGKAQPGFLFDIVLLDKQGKEIGRIPANIVETQAEETIQVQAEITESYINAYDFKMVEK